MLAVVVILSIMIVVFGEVWWLLEKSARFTYNIVWERPGTFSFATSGINEIQGSILSTLDMMLIASLVMMVTIGGYENTVSKLGIGHSFPSWFGKLDVGQLKIKVAASIVIISSVHLLMTFMALEYDDSNLNLYAVAMSTIIHVVFVLAALILAYMEKISHRDRSSYLLRAISEGKKTVQDRGGDGV